MNEKKLGPEGHIILPCVVTWTRGKKKIIGRDTTSLTFSVRVKGEVYHTGRLIGRQATQFLRKVERDGKIPAEAIKEGLNHA